MALWRKRPLELTGLRLLETDARSGGNETRRLSQLLEDRFRFGVAAREELGAHPSAYVWRWIVQERLKRLSPSGDLKQLEVCASHFLGEGVITACGVSEITLLDCSYTKRVNEIFAAHA